MIRRVNVLIMFFTAILMSGCIAGSEVTGTFGSEGHIYDNNNAPVTGAEIKITDIKGKWDNFDKDGVVSDGKWTSDDVGYYIFMVGYTKRRQTFLFSTEYTQYVSEFTYSVSKEGYKTEYVTIKVSGKEYDQYEKKHDVTLYKE